LLHISEVLLWFGKLSNKRKEGNIAAEIIHDELKPMHMLKANIFMT